MQCATRTHAARKMHPPSVQYTSVQRALAQHSVQPHAACNTHPCSTQLAGALHTGAAGATLTRNTHCTCREHSRHPALHGPAGRDGQTDRYTHTHTQPPTHPFSAPCHAHAGPSPTAGGVRGVGEQRGSQQSPADAAPAAPAAARPGTEAAAAAAARPTWLQWDGTAARLLHVGDGAVWMQSTSRPPPGRQSGGLGGQSSLSLQQRLTDTAAYGRPARSQQSAPRGAESPSFLPPLCPPATPPRRAAGPQSGVHGWCVSVCV